MAARTLPAASQGETVKPTSAVRSAAPRCETGAALHELPGSVPQAGTEDGDVHEAWRSPAIVPRCRREP